MPTIDTGLFLNTTVAADRTTAAGARRALSSLLLLDGAGNPRQGVLPSPGITVAPAGLAVTSASTSALTFTVAQGYAVLKRAPNPSLGAYLAGTITGVTLTLAAAATSPRIDIVYIAMPDPEVGDGTTLKPRIDVITGTPSGTPVAPTASLPVGSMALAQILVPANATAASATTITDARKFTAVSSAPFYAATTADLPTTGAYGQLAIVGTGGSIYRYVGTSWVMSDGDGTSGLQFPGTVTNLTPATNGSSLVRSGLIVSLNLHINVGSAGTSSGSPVLAVIPAGWRPAANTDTVMRTSQDQLIQVAVEVGGNVSLRGSSASVPANIDVYGSVTWTNRYV